MLLERDSILDSLDRLAVDAIAGHGRVVFVVGEAGIGKTSVLRAAAARMDGRLRLMWAVCEDWSTAEALTILRDLPVIDAAALDNAHVIGTRRLRKSLEAIAKVFSIHSFSIAVRERRRPIGAANSCWSGPATSVRLSSTRVLR